MREILTRYSKGARSERELLKELHEKGFSVMRGAGSGINTLSPDIIAVKEGIGYAFECKAWDNDNLSIEHDRFQGLLDWESNTKMHTFIAWRMNSNGWFFIKLSEMKHNDKSKTITKKMTLDINRRLEAILV